MLRLATRYGIVAGLLVCIHLLWITVTPPEALMERGAVYGYAAMIVALTAVFLGIKRYRDQTLGGVIRFGQAALVGLGISFVAAIVYVVGWEVCLAVSGLDFGSVYAQAMIDAARQKGVSGAELTEVVADAEAFAKSYADPLYRMPITFVEIFPVGVLITLVSAAVLRNSRILPARQA
jgi:hypothetical protein